MKIFKQRWWLGIAVLSMFYLAPTASAENVYEQLVSQVHTQGTVRLIVGVKSVSDPESITRAQKRFLRFMRGYSIQRVHQFAYLPYLALESNYAALRRIRRYHQLTTLEEDSVAKLTLSESIPLIAADVAWENGYTGSGQTIAIFDTGVDSAHEFLSNKVIDQACFSSGEISLCPNGQATDTTSSNAGEPCTGYDGCDHGTHVAGIAAGKGQDFSGVAKDATLISIQIFSGSTDPADCDDGEKTCLQGYQSDMYRALEYIYAISSDYNIAAINMSVGNDKEYTEPCDDDSRAAFIELLRSAGTATTTSAGNDSFANGLSSPSCISATVSVGNTTKTDEVRSTSNSAYYLDLLAPGTDIFSSIPDQQYESKSGTSMAAPHVAGAFAVLRSMNQSWSVDDIESTLKATGKQITDPKSGITTPRINLEAALIGACTIPANGDWVVPQDCVVPQTTIAHGNVIVQSGVVLHIMNGARFDVDFDNHYLKIEHGGGVRLRDNSIVD